MKLVTTIGIIVLTFISARAQENRTWLGFESGISQNQNLAVDFGSNLKAFNRTDLSWGFHLRQDSKKGFFIETGFLRNNIGPNYGFKSLDDIDGSFIEPSIRTLQIPIRLGTKINLYKQKYHLVPVIGYSFGMILNPNKVYGNIVGTTSNLKDTVNFIASTKRLGQYYSLIQTGLSLECKLKKIFLLSLSVNYYGGFQSLLQTDIIYHSNRRPNSTARVISTGSYLCYGASLKIPFHPIRKMKKLISKGW